MFSSGDTAWMLLLLPSSPKRDPHGGMISSHVHHWPISPVLLPLVMKIETCHSLHEVGWMQCFENWGLQPLVVPSIPQFLYIRNLLYHLHTASQNLVKILCGRVVGCLLPLRCMQLVNLLQYAVTLMSLLSFGESLCDVF